MFKFFPVKKTSTFLSSLTRLLFVCTFVLLRNLLFSPAPSSLGTLRVPRSRASRGASRLGRPGSVRKSCPASKLAVPSFHPSPGCWTFKKFQGCLYCLIFDFQGSFALGACVPEAFVLCPSRGDLCIIPPVFHNVNNYFEKVFTCGNSPQNAALKLLCRGRAFLRSFENSVPLHRTNSNEIPG